MHIKSLKFTEFALGENLLSCSYKAQAVGNKPKPGWLSYNTNLISNLIEYWFFKHGNILGMDVQAEMHAGFRHVHRYTTSELTICRCAHSCLHPRNFPTNGHCRSSGTCSHMEFPNSVTSVFMHKFTCMQFPSAVICRHVSMRVVFWHRCMYWQRCKFQTWSRVLCMC